VPPLIVPLTAVWPSTGVFIVIVYADISVFVVIVTGSESGLGERHEPAVTFATIVVPAVRLNPVAVHVPFAATVAVPRRGPAELFW
jgi:hypothetical protein